MSKPDGSEVSISNPSASTIEIVPDITGEFDIGLTVYDDTDTSKEDVVTITVTALPIAIAGSDTTVSRDIGIFINRFFHDLSQTPIDH